MVISQLGELNKFFRGEVIKNFELAEKMDSTLSAMPMSSVLVRNRIGGSTTVFLPSTPTTTQSSPLPLNLEHQQHHQHHYQQVKEYKQEIRHEKKQQTFYRNNVDIDDGADDGKKVEVEKYVVNEEHQQKKQKHLDGYQRRNSNSNYSMLCMDDEKNKVEQNSKKKLVSSSSSLLPSSSSLLLFSTRSSSQPSSVQSAINITTANTTSVQPQSNNNNINSALIYCEKPEYNSHVVTIKVKTEKEIIRKEIQVNTNSTTTTNSHNYQNNNFQNNISDVHLLNNKSVGYNSLNNTNTSVVSNNKPLSSKISFVSTVGLSPSECLITKSANKSLIKIEQQQHESNLRHFGVGVVDSINHNSKTNDEMVQKSDLDVNNQQYYYYMMPSGQCSPSDTLDSGTCSDLEVSPPPVPKKMSPTSKYLHNSHHLDHHNSNDKTANNNKTETEKQNNAKNSKTIASTTNNVNTNGINGINTHNTNNNNNCKIKNTKSNGNLSDSDESQISVNCDSLNGSDIINENSGNSIMNGLSITKITSSSSSSLPPPPPPPLHQSLLINTTIKSDKNEFDQQKKAIVSCLPDSLLQDIRERSLKLNQIERPSPPTTVTSSINSSPLSLSPEQISPVSTPTPLNKFELRSYKSNNRMARDKYVPSSPSVYENDKFYKFHINEHYAHKGSNIKPAKVDIDEAFAGYKDINSGTSTIRSNKGTIRGVKNRVRNGIATFLQMQHTSIKVISFSFHFLSNIFILFFFLQ